MELVIFGVKWLTVGEEEHEVTLALFSPVLEWAHQLLTRITDMLVLLGSTELVRSQEVKHVL